jgi:hypothetical protein
MMAADAIRQQEIDREVENILTERYPYAAQYAIAQSVESAWAGHVGYEWHCKDCRYLEWSYDYDSTYSEPACNHGVERVSDGQAELSFGATCWGFRPRLKTDKHRRRPREIVEKCGLPWEWTIRNYVSRGYDRFVLGLLHLRLGDHEGYVDAVCRDDMPGYGDLIP